DRSSRRCTPPIRTDPPIMIRHFHKGYWETRLNLQGGEYPMNREDFTKELKKILTDNNIGTMATVRDNKPMSRYMYFYNDGLTLYTYTRKGTYKVEDLEKNPNTHILLGYEEREGLGERYVEIEGKA